MTQFNLEMTFRSETLSLPTVQRLVGLCNGYFKYNPLMLKPYSLVDIGFNEVTDVNKFNVLHKITKQPFF